MNTVYVLTYNTADKPERRIIDGVYTTKEKADDARKELKRAFGDFLVDSEIDARELR